jgi:hypothetical protein
MERYQYGVFVAQEVSKLNMIGLSSPKFAYIMNIPVLDYGRYGETVAINRGMKVKATDNPDEALSWLGLPTNLL